MSTEIRVIYYEEDDVLREMTAAALRKTLGLKLLYYSKDYKLIRAHIENFNPRLILMDISCKRKILEMVRLRFPEIQILFLGDSDEEDFIHEAIVKGGSGYLMKHSSVKTIIKAIFDIYNGTLPLSVNITNKIIRHFKDERLGVRNYRLSSREMELVKCLIKGHSYKLIADELGIKLDTVRSHLRNIYEKLDVNSRTEAIMKVLKDGMLY